MARLKDRQRQIPNGLFFYLAQTKWKSRPGSFSNVTDQLIRHLQGNQVVAKQLGWPLHDRAFMENVVDSFNARVCEKNGWTDFYTNDGGPLPKSQPRSSSPWWAGPLAVAAGVATLKDWFGEGMTPVSRELANARAAICASCPMNEPGDLLSFFTVPAAEYIRKQIERRGELHLLTTSDSKLNVCSGCYCPLPLKVHTPIEHIKNRMPASVRKDLDPKCWVLKEMQ